MSMHQETPDHGAPPEHGTRQFGSTLRAPAVVGSLVLVILVLGASAGAYALTRPPAKGPSGPVPMQVTAPPVGTSIQDNATP